MLTYKKWRTAVIDSRMREHQCSKADAKYGLTYSDYWRCYVVKSLNAGESLTTQVCRSIAKNHPYPILAWIDRNYPGQMPSVFYDTGRVCNSGESKPTAPKREWSHSELFK